MSAGEGYSVCVVGVGAVGKEMIRLLRERQFPIRSLKILARRSRVENIFGTDYEVRAASQDEFSGVDLAFFAGTEGAKGASRRFGWAAGEQGGVVVDNGDDFRMDERVPLVIPEINAHALEKHRGFIANPNCTTIITLMAVAPIHRAAGVRRMVACSYQAVSGSGSAAIAELEEQVRAYCAGQAVEAKVYPRPIAFSVLPVIGSADANGVTSEEAKLRRETHKILGDSSIRVTATCARVPVFNGHSVAVHLELENALSPENARRLLAAAPGVRVVDDLAGNLFPTPQDASGCEEVLVGRIRRDDTVEHGLSLFVCGDNLWKGAALNAVQIAEELVRRGRLKPQSD
ncbi:MAG: aspartate-semialdehyde dehydrogenase [Verrucomicrobia bacterium]|nr:MAG: aspartate-semialdehyde dehydrogenase [Verrucomicrobiota bacterium]